MNGRRTAIDTHAEEKLDMEALCPTWTVSVSPHLKSAESVARVMWTVAACLVPSLILSVLIFGFQCLIIALVSAGSCAATEAITQKLLHRPITVRDGSAVVTGLLLAFVIPPGVPYWLPVLGAVMSIYVAKHLFGGIGFNIFNPALIGRAFLMATFPVAMTSAWLAPASNAGIFRFMSGIDAVTTATPLYVLKHQGLGALVEKFGSLATIYGNFLIGWRPGCIGETSVLFLLIGGLFLMYRGYITWHTPVSMIVSVGFFSWVFGGESLFTGNPVLAVLSGGVVLGAFFMATDYVTSPSGATAKLVFGTGIGILTVLIRLKGGYPEGVCYAILLMNPLSPALEGWFKPERFAPPKGATK